MADISIVIPCYNSDLFLEETIESVLRQTHTDWRLILVDDGSTDGTRATLRRYAAQDSRISVIEQENAGVARARNRGLAEIDALSEYVIVLDNDDIWKPDALALLREALSRHPAASAAYGLAWSMDENGKFYVQDEASALSTIWGRWRRGIVGRRLVSWSDHTPTSFAVLAHHNCIGTPGQVLIRRSVLDRVGLFDPATVPADDWDLWIRLSLLGDLIFIPQFIMNKREYGGNLSSNKKAMAGAELMTRQKLLMSPLLTPDQQATALWGHFYEAVPRFNWARASIRQHRYAEGLEHASSGVREYVRFAVLLCTVARQRSHHIYRRLFNQILRLDGGQP